MFKKTIAMTGAAALLALGLTGCGATLGGGAQSEAVSYTHLTLPTICSV